MTELVHEFETGLVQPAISHRATFLIKDAFEPGPCLNLGFISKSDGEKTLVGLPITRIFLACFQLYP